MILPTIALLACSNPEEIPEGDIYGHVVIPKAAATRTVVSATDADGDGTYTYETREETDPRLLGPVYIGAFSGIDDISFPYKYPRMGPVIGSEYGDTFPYGGITVGRLDFACYEDIACEVTTGRFTDYDDVLDYFRNSLGKPILDTYGREVMTGDTFRQWCYEYFDATADEEMAFIGPDNLSFEEDGDNFVGSFVLNHTNRVEGMVLWAFMDAPEVFSDQIPLNGSFTTCDSGGGRSVDEYNSEFREGRSAYDVLNQPQKYLSYGDWVADGEAVVNFDDEGNQTEPDIAVNLNFEYKAEASP